MGMRPTRANAASLSLQPPHNRRATQGQQTAAGRRGGQGGVGQGSVGGRRAGVRRAGARRRHSRPQEGVGGAHDKGGDGAGGGAGLEQHLDASLLHQAGQDLGGGEEESTRVCAWVGLVCVAAASQHSSQQQPASRQQPQQPAQRPARSPVPHSLSSQPRRRPSTGAGKQGGGAAGWRPAP